MQYTSLFVLEAYTLVDVYSLLISEFSFYEYILQRPSSFVPYNWRFFVDLSKKRLVLYQLPGWELMVDIAWQRAKRFFLLEVFVGVPLSCFESAIQRELKLLILWISSLTLRCFWNSSSLENWNSRRARCLKPVWNSHFFAMSSMCLFSCSSCISCLTNART